MYSTMDTLTQKEFRQLVVEHNFTEIADAMIDIEFKRCGLFWMKWAMFETDPSSGPSVDIMRRVTPRLATPKACHAWRQSHTQSPITEKAVRQMEHPSKCDACVYYHLNERRNASGNLWCAKPVCTVLTQEPAN
jgi:hypothetical protein